MKAARRALKDARRQMPFAWRGVLILDKEFDELTEDDRAFLDEIEQISREEGLSE